MKKTLIIDGNSLGYKYQAMAKLTVGGQEIQAVFGMVKGIRNLKSKYPQHTMMVLWDGHAQWRYDLLPATADHPGYKGDRDKDPQQALMRSRYKSQKPIIQRALKALGIRQVSATTHEADDMAGYFAKLLDSDDEDDEIIFVTGDGDWLQFVKKGVTWYDPIRDVTVTMDNFFEHTGYFNGFEFLQGKALMGDTSDKIPGVGGIGEKGAPVFLAEHKNVAEFFRKVDSGEFKPKGKVQQRFATKAGKLAFARNFKLMNLKSVPKPNPEDVTVTKDPLSEDEFKGLCEELAFRSILVDLNNFLKPFRNKY